MAASRTACCILLYAVNASCPNKSYQYDELCNFMTDVADRWIFGIASSNIVREIRNVRLINIQHLCDSHVLKSVSSDKILNLLSTT